MWHRWFGRQKKALNEKNQPVTQPLSEADGFSESKNVDTPITEDIENFPRKINSQPRVEEALDLDKSATTLRNAETWLECGSKQLESGNFEEALISFNHVLEIKPDSHETWKKRGDALINLARYKVTQLEEPPGYNTYEGSQIIKQAIYTVVTKDDSEKLEEAISNYDRAVEIKPDYHEAWYNRGNTLLELGRANEAIFSYQQAVEIKPDYYEAWEKYGDVLFKLERWEDALYSYDQTVYYNPNNGEVWLRHGQTLSKLERYKEAIASFDKAYNPSDFYSVYSDHCYSVYLNKGNALLALGKWEEAIFCFRKVISATDQYLIWYGLGIALYNSGRFEEAVHCYEHTLVSEPKYWQAWINRGWAAAASKKCEAPVALSFPVALQNPVLDHRGDYRAAVINCIEGLKYVQQTQDPEGWGQLHRYTGRAYYIQGRDNAVASYYYRQALRSYETAAPALEPFCEFYLELIHDMLQVHIGLRNTAEAKGLLQKASELLDRLLKETPSPNQRKQLRLRFSGFRQLTVTFLAQEGKFIEALQSAEIEKQAFLTWLLSNEDLPPNNQDFSSEQSLHYQFRQLLANRPTTAILSWHLSPAALTTFLLLPQSSDPILIPAPDPAQVTDQPTSLKQVIDLENWIKTWNLDYADYINSSSKHARESHSWRTKMLKRLEDLKHHLNLSAILEHLPGITQLILIPHRDLHRFPLHALFPKAFTITYLPSLQVGINLQQCSCTPIQNLLITEAPNSTENSTNPKKFERLEHASLESLMIRQLFSNTTISSTEATHSVLYKHLQSFYDGFHFTGHSAYNASVPTQSALYLTGEDCLTVTDICGAPLLLAAINLSVFLLVKLHSQEIKPSQQNTWD